MARYSSRSAFESSGQHLCLARNVLLVLTVVVLVELIWLLVLVAHHAATVANTALRFVLADIAIFAISTLIAVQFGRKRTGVHQYGAQMSDVDINQSAPWGSLNLNKPNAKSRKPKKSTVPWKTLGLVILTIAQLNILAQNWIDHKPVMVPRLLLISLLVDLAWIDFVILVMLLVNDHPQKLTIKQDT